MKTHHLRITTAALIFTAGIAPVQAVMLNPNGVGQALVYPYYTVNNGQDTLVSVVNDSEVGKLVKVRFREGYNGRTVLDFDLYLGAHDAWAGAISAADGSASGAARLISSDLSCSSLDLTAPVPFRTTAFDGSTANFPADGGPTSAARTREGQIEVIAIGDIVADSPTATAITIVFDPANSSLQNHCDQLPGDVSADLVAPTSGLFGSGIVVDVGNGMFYGYNADALSDFTDRVLMTDLASADGPTLADANSSASVAGGALASVLVKLAGNETPVDDASADHVLTLDYARGIDAVSAVFMASRISNEFLVVPGLGANTDWVVTFPTKQFYVDKQLYPGASAPAPLPPTAPFQTAFIAGEAPNYAQGFAATNHEGTHIPPRCAPHPECFGLTHFAHQVNVVPLDAGPLFPSASKVLGSHLLAVFEPPLYDPAIAGSGGGWLSMDFVLGDPFYTLIGADWPQAPADSDISLAGLPMSGFMVYNIVNSNAAPGRLANYGGTFRHRGTAPQGYCSRSQSPLVCELVD